MPLCAISVPAYRAAPYILEMVESFRRQAVVPGWEYDLRIGVDNNDLETSRVLLGAGVKHLICRSHATSNVLRNTLWMLAPADVYAAFDADDVMDPDYLAAMLPLVRENTIATSGYRKISSDGRLLWERTNYEGGICMMSADVLDRLGGMKPARVCADSEFFFRAKRAGIRFKHVDRPLFSYREHPGSLSCGDGGAKSPAWRAEWAALKAALPRTPDRIEPVTCLLEDPSVSSSPVLPGIRTVAFADFWPDLDPVSNYFTDLLPGAEVVPADKNPDVLWYSVFGQSHRDLRARFKLHYSGENTDPSTSAHWNFTFRPDNASKRNTRLPLWVEKLDYRNPESPVFFDRLVGSCLFNNARPGSSVFIFRNPADGSPRKEIFDLLCPDSLGELWNNTGRRVGPTWDEKIEAMSRYHYAVASENSLGSGYVTEKLLHALAAGCVPVYWGDLEYAVRDFNFGRVAVFNPGASVLEIGLDAVLRRPSPVLTPQAASEFSLQRVREKVAAALAAPPPAPGAKLVSASVRARLAVLRQGRSGRPMV